MPRLINDRQKRMLIAILMHDKETINMPKAGQTLRALMRVGYIEETLKPNTGDTHAREDGFQGWKITPIGHTYLASMRKP